MATRKGIKRKQPLRLVAENTSEAVYIEREAERVARRLRGEPCTSDLASEYEYLKDVIETHLAEVHAIDGDAVRRELAPLEAGREKDLRRAEQCERDGRPIPPALAARAERMWVLRRLADRDDELRALAARLCGALLVLPNDVGRRTAFVDRLDRFAEVYARLAKAEPLAKWVEGFVVAAKDDDPRIADRLDRDHVRALIASAIQKPARRGRPEKRATMTRAQTIAQLVSALGFPRIEGAEALRAARTRERAKSASGPLVEAARAELARRKQLRRSSPPKK